MLGENLIASRNQSVALASEVSSRSKSSQEDGEKKQLASTGPATLTGKAGADVLSLSASVTSTLAGASEAKAEGKETEESAQSEELATSVSEQTEEQMEKIAEAVNKKLDSNLNIRFFRDEDTGADFFQLIEKKSGDIIRQFPPEEFIEIQKKNQEVSSMLFSEQA